ncbi:hybrid sensor histidine kinase/response regulator [Microvirga pudoricolor]|uniref:hybrid sensor histidine kinase/response regulator n=1 Tax=Microvirga pudoricolor TaxID=2778729 RepID=UPI001951CF33|nr:response regulator [Microvirga pudoricolor]MBM6594800.1 response regulator [Microvirga pudoricolor]
MTDIRKQLLAAFESEHREHLGTIRHALDRAEAGAAFDMADVFRRAHSLKGAARAVDLPAVEDLAHRLEALFSQILEGRRTLDPPTIAALRTGLDGIEDLVAEIDNPASTFAPTAALSALDRLLGGDSAPPPAPAALPATPQAPVSQAPAPHPAPASADPILAPEPPPGEAGSTYLRVAAEQIEELSGSMHQLMADLQAEEAISDAISQVDSELRGLRRSWDALQVQVSALVTVSQRANGQGGAVPRSLGPRLKEFDQNLKGLFRRLSALSREQRQLAWATEQAAHAVRENIDRVSLVSVETVFGSFGHMVRDLARQEGKAVRVRTAGLDIQADRRVLQALKDPVMHLLRNAVNHGIETPDERRTRRKPDEAEVSLEFASKGGRLEISIRDDGRGPDLNRIEAVAVQRGLLPERRRGEMMPPADQLLSLVFAPGFSTAATVDKMSGRGMGLSVVAEAVRRLHGSVRLRQRHPAGAEAHLSVPFTAARQSLLLVEAEGRMYGLPTHNIDRLLRLPAARLESVEGRPVARIEVGGQDVMVPVVALAALTGSLNAPIPIEAGSVKAVLVRQGARHCALAVNVFQDVRTMLVGDVDAIGLDETVSGTVLLEDELPALVLSPEALVEHWVRNESRLAAGGLGLAEWAPKAEKRATTILVVDDSITTRTLEKSILEAQGYRVVLSVDGLDALNLLRSGEAVVDLVIADVEMPRMDGFGLLQAVKADARLASLPVILMTSRDDPEDVRRGLDLGASAYITKQKFDQRELLGTIGQLL